MKKLLQSFYLTMGLLTSLVILILLMQSSSIAEWWTVSISRLYQIYFGWIIAIFPFSLMETIFVSWIVLMGLKAITAINMMARKQWRDILLPLNRIAIYFLIMTNLYVATAGMAYNRKPLPIPQYNGAVPYTQYVEIIQHYIDDFNAIANTLSFDEDGSVISPSDLTELNHWIHEGFATLDAQYFNPYSTTVKPLLTSFLYREFHITGIHFAPSTEALINVLVPDALLPFTMAHELAHAKGVMREEDANLVAMYLCLTSDHPFLRYSGYFNTFYALLNLSRYIGEPSAYASLYMSLNESIRRDYQFQGLYWSQYDLLDRFATWVNDVYLRLFGTDGVSSYVDVPVITVIDDGENTIEVISEFSPFQKLFFELYFTSSVF